VRRGPSAGTLACVDLSPERRQRLTAIVDRLRADLIVFHAERIVDAEAQRTAQPGAAADRLTADRRRPE
jgi:hypothetical protein